VWLAAAGGEARSGAPHPLGRAAVRLADGTRIGWQRGRWSVSGAREISFAER
jgi:hypothetical protein